jgi:hypothetical protein
MPMQAAITTIAIMCDFFISVTFRAQSYSQNERFGLENQRF